MPAKKHFEMDDATQLVGQALFKPPVVKREMQPQNFNVNDPT